MFKAHFDHREGRLRLIEICLIDAINQARVIVDVSVLNCSAFNERLELAQRVNNASVRQLSDLSRS